MLEKRDKQCGSALYNDAELEACRSTLCMYDDRQGPGGYPHFFRNLEKFNFGTYTGDLYEYPLIGGNGVSAYNGGE